MRRIPDNNLSYPLSISLSSGNFGTGFIVDVAPHLYLVTARHVLFEPDGVTLLASHATITGYNRELPGSPRVVVQIDLGQLLAENQLRSHATNDVAVARIASISPEAKMVRPLIFTSGVHPVDLAGEYFTGVNLEHNCKRFSEVLEANEVIVFGYPVSLGLASTPQLDSSKPLLRQGIVAAKNESMRTIIVDCPVYPGNSGGPVLEIEKVGDATHFDVIGVVSQFVPAAERWINVPYGYENINMSNSGYSVIAPVDAIDEIIATF